MSSVQIGQRIEIDTFALRMPNEGAGASAATGVVVALGPGTITVRLLENGRLGTEVTVGPGRLRGLQ
jgi:hypothetical protein